MQKTQILAILSLLILFAFFNIFLRNDSERSIYSKLILDKKADSVTVKELFPRRNAHKICNISGINQVTVGLSKGGSAHRKRERFRIVIMTDTSLQSISNYERLFYAVPGVTEDNANRIARQINSFLENPDETYMEESIFSIDNLVFLIIFLCLIAMAYFKFKESKK